MTSNETCEDWFRARSAALATQLESEILGFDITLVSHTASARLFSTN